MDHPLNFSQQHHIFDADHARKVTLLGAGSVGSVVATMLAKLGVTDLTVWDADSVESHNVPMSAYRPCDLSRPKVDALADIVREQAGVDIVPVRRMYEGGALEGTVVCSVDSMDVRSAVWKEVRLCPSVDLFVDTRTAKELVSVFAIDPVDPDDCDFYDAFVYPSRDALRTMCGEHGAIHVASAAALAVASGLTGWWQRGTKRRHFQMIVGSLDVPEE